MTSMTVRHYLAPGIRQDLAACSSIKEVECSAACVLRIVQSCFQGPARVEQLFIRVGLNQVVR